MVSSSLVHCYALQPDQAVCSKFYSELLRVQAQFQFCVVSHCGCYVSEVHEFGFSGGSVDDLYGFHSPVVLIVVYGYGHPRFDYFHRRGFLWFFHLHSKDNTFS